MNNSMQYLSSFYPLCSTKKGMQAIEDFSFPKYIDGSCRREPDFQNEYPAITGLCRPGFSKKLEEGDLVIYLTNKRGIGKNRLVAILEVIKKCNKHNSAKKWYDDNGIDLPNNLMVSGTKYFNLNQTHQMMFWDKGCDSDTIKAWNNCYVERAKNDSDIAICKVWEGILELNNPRVIEKTELETIFSRRTSTQNPPLLKEEEWKEFQKLLHTK